MKNFNADVNRIILETLNKRVEPIFPYNNEEFESNEEKNEICSENNFTLNKILKERGIYKPKINNEINPIKFDNYSELNLDYYFRLTNENNDSNFYQDLFSPFKEGKLDFLYKNEKIFKIDKINKKIGRIKKNSLLKGIHNKLSEDNIIRKIKVRFHEKLRLYLNEEYKRYSLNKSSRKKKIINWLKKINPKISRRIKKAENLKWFKTKVFEIFSQNISLKYSAYSPDLNKKKIEKLIISNEAKNIITILNSDVETMFEKYVNDEKIDGFKTLKDDLEELKSQMEKSNIENINGYLEKYEYVAKNMKKIFEQKSERNHKCLKIKKK